MCAVTIKELDQDKLTAIGAKDSKLLTPKAREVMYNQITEIATDYKIKIIQPKDVDLAVNSTSTNLNWLEADTAAELVNKLKVDKVIIDCPSTNTKAFKDYLSKLIKTEIIAEHKADTCYPVVAAASILAKVTRDREIQKIKTKYRIDFGSGYPSDPRTKQFLLENYNKYPIFRKSWSTYKKITDKQTTLI